MKFPARIEISENTAVTIALEPRLPTFEEATGQDVSRLPSYCESFRMRYHPYRRTSILVDPIDRLLNTIYDDERIMLVGVPPALPSPPVVAPLVPGPLIVRPRGPDAVQLQRRRLGTLILNEFIAGLHRARHG